MTTHGPRGTARAPQGSLRCLASLALASLALVAVTLGACGAAHGARHDRAPSSTPAAGSRPIVRDTRPYIIAAIGACKRGVNTAYWLPRASKEDLYRTCAGGLKDSITVEGEVGREVCAEVVYASPLKSASAKARAFAACDDEIKLKTTMTR